MYCIVCTRTGFGASQQLVVTAQEQLIEYPLTNCLYNVEQMETWQVSHVREHVCSFSIPYNADVPKFVSSSHCVEVQHTASCHKPTHV